MSRTRKSAEASASQPTLEAYRHKRNFAQTSEPSPPLTSRKRKVTPAPQTWRFVVQRHHATALHYDLRLELNGVLRSWAVPQGPSLDPKQRRLAIEVEDHPLDYASFEGFIAPGNYGAGRVYLWDQGVWSTDQDAHAALAAGKLRFRLQGERLQGAWRLVRTRSTAQQRQWLLIKEQDEFVSQQPLEAVLPEFVLPQLPTLTSQPPQGAEWIHELKLDGYRMQARWDRAAFQLRSRSGLDWTNRYPELANPFGKLRLGGTILDGEVVALDKDGRANFAALQNRRQRALPLVFFAFDLLFDAGDDLRTTLLMQRKERLQKLLAQLGEPRLLYLDHVTHDATQLLQQCQRLGLEGVVSKQHVRPYEPGRSCDWLKCKLRSHEPLVVGGYETSGRRLSSLLVGYFDDDGKFLFAGRVGTGWNAEAERELRARMKRCENVHSPFARDVPTKPRSSNDVEVQWVKPTLVVRIAFAEWAKGVLRQASFLGLDDEIPAHTVTAERLFQDQASRTFTHTSRPAVQALALPTSANGLTHPGRLLFPEVGITKQEVASYLYQVSDWMLPHLIDRVISLLRCTTDIHQQVYFQRHPGRGTSAEMTSVPLPGEAEPYLTIQSAAGLLATAQMNAIELHPWGSRLDKLERPDRLVIDLDPDDGLAWHTVVEAALQVREELTRRRMVSFVKTTGGKGLHIVVPIERRYTWDALFAYAKALAAEFSKRAADRFTDNMSKARRTGRIYMDFHRNRRGATAIAPYSLRARSHAPVATPVAWDELDRIQPQDFTPRTVPARLAHLATDPWQELAVMRQRLR